MSLVYIPCYTSINTSKIHEVFYIMNTYREKGEKVFLEYKTENLLFDAAKNTAVLSYTNDTNKLVGFSWLKKVEFVNKGIKDYFLYSHFIVPEHRKRIEKKCQLMYFTKKTIKDYVDKTEDDVKGILGISINKKVSERVVNKHYEMNHLGLDHKNRRLAYWHLDGSKIDFDKFLKWKESRR